MPLSHKQGNCFVSHVSTSPGGEDISTRYDEYSAAIGCENKGRRNYGACDPLCLSFSKAVIPHTACSSQIAADSRTRDRSLVDSSNLHDHACARIMKVIDKYR